MSITADIPVGQRRRGDVRLVLVDVGYRTGEPDTYAVPLAVVSGHRAHWASTFEPESVVAALANENLIVDATCDSSALAALIRTLVRPSRRDDEIEADTTPALRRILRRITDDDVRRLGAEQSNTSLVVDDEVLIKLFRRVERGENPDLQISRHLAKVGLRHVPNPQGSLSRRRSRSEWDTLAIAYDFVPNEGDGWSRALSHLSLLYDDLLTGRDGVPPDEAETVTDGVAALGVELLGQRTAELHVALGEATPDGGLGVEPFTALYQRSLYQGFRSAIKSTLGRLRRVDPSQVDPDLAAAVLDGEKQLTARLEPLRDRVLAGQRIRCHGDYHLGQVLYTGSDWMIIDFEGEPNRPISERQILRSPATDVAGMLRSFDYAATVGLRDRVERALLDDIDDPVAGRCAARWRDRAAESFLAGYFGQAEVTSLWPDEEPASQTLIDLYLLDKALHELRYELANRPAWAGIPLRQLRALAEGDPVAVGW
jgi:maltose alpha-D-glucosyltransferase/alpha-amylase